MNERDVNGDKERKRKKSANAKEIGRRDRCLDPCTPPARYGANCLGRRYAWLVVVRVVVALSKCGCRGSRGQFSALRRGQKCKHSDDEVNTTTTHPAQLYYSFNTDLG